MTPDGYCARLSRPEQRKRRYPWAVRSPRSETRSLPPSNAVHSSVPAGELILTKPGRFGNTRAGANSDGTLRWPVGLSRWPREARAFYATLAVATGVGMVINFVPLYWALSPTAF